MTDAHFLSSSLELSFLASVLAGSHSYRDLSSHVDPFHKEMVKTIIGQIPPSTAFILKGSCLQFVLIIIVSMS